MELISAIKNRRSVRKFIDQAVPKEIIQELIDLAVWAPSATNKQPWGFLVVDDREYLLQLSEEIKKGLLQDIDQNCHLKPYKEMLAKDGYHIFHNAPVLVAIYGNASESSWYINDCSLAAQNFMLAAYGKGLVTCWTGFAQKLLNSTEFKQKHGIPVGYQIVAPIILGYPEKFPSQGLARKDYPIFR
ncbi:nitroreductase [Peptococcaceae bacterium 1198_IL3148]